MKAYIVLLMGVLSGSYLFFLRKRIGMLRVGLLLIIWLLAADGLLLALYWMVPGALRGPAHWTSLGRSGAIPLLVLVSASLVIMLGYWRDERNKPRPGHCPKCGYNLTGNLSGVCPECGQKTEQKCCNR